MGHESEWKRIIQRKIKFVRVYDAYLLCFEKVCLLYQLYKKNQYLFGINSEVSSKWSSEVVLHYFLCFRDKVYCLDKTSIYLVILYCEIWVDIYFS